jgi:hypothetical protein
MVVMPRAKTKSKPQSADSPAAIAAVDAFLAGGDLKPGKRASRKNTWRGGARVVVKPVAQELVEKHRLETPAPKKLTVVGGEALRRAGFVHGFSTRVDGDSRIYSGGERGELNLSWTQDDDMKSVTENRRRFLRAVAGTAKCELVTVRQIHSPIVRVIRREKKHWMVDGRSVKSLASADGRAVLRGDGMLSDVPGLLLGIQTADCIPVLIGDRRSGAVGAFHAGWRGTLARIVERGIGMIQKEFGARVEDIVAAIGPGIGPCCYAVGEEVRQEFESQFAYARELFTEVYDEDPVRTKYPLLFLTARAPGHSPIGPQLHLNLWDANRRQLLDAGVPARQISVVKLCTACDTTRFFSHRAEHGFTGRMLNVIAAKRPRK